MKNQKLTDAEEQVMKHLWKMGSCYLKDLVAAYESPAPAYTTIATLVSRMVDKGFVGYRQRGSVREYYPLVEKSKYFTRHLGEIIHDFFNDSTSQFASFFTRESDLSVEQLTELRELIDKQIKDRK